MMDPDKVRAIALSLPEAEDRSANGMLRFSVRSKQFAWSYLERPAPRQARQPRPDVLAVRCAAEAKDTLLAAAPDRLFTTDHYNGFPAVLVRLAKVDESEMRGLLVAAWRCQAPRGLAKTYALAFSDSSSVGERHRSLNSGSRTRRPKGAGGQ
jgi:hypothetical protein